MANLVKKTASCLNMLEWFEANGQIVKSPLPGDIVFFKYKTNNRRTNHVGLVFHIEDVNKFSTIEGNTSLNSNDNGGSVMCRQRTNANVVAFARPKYQNKDQINRILARAQAEIGITEYPPNSNNVKYNTWFYGRQVSGANYPWCAAFISYIFNADDEPAKPKESNPILRKGSKGHSVKYAQELLRSKGYDIMPDGDFGPKTEAAVKAFQKVNKLVDDGIIGPKTWEVLTK